MRDRRTAFLEAGRAIASVWANGPCPRASAGIGWEMVTMASRDLEFPSRETSPSNAHPAGRSCTQVTLNGEATARAIR